MIKKIQRRIKIKAHIRSKIAGTAERPRLSVFRSNKQIYVQVIDDKSGKTLAAASSLAIAEKLAKKGTSRKSGRIDRKECSGSRSYKCNLRP